MKRWKDRQGKYILSGNTLANPQKVEWAWQVFSNHALESLNLGITLNTWELRQIESFAQSVVQKEIHFPKAIQRWKLLRWDQEPASATVFERLELPYLKQCHCSKLFENSALAHLAVPGSSERYPWQTDSRGQIPEHRPTVWLLPSSLEQEWLWSHLFLSTSWAQLTSGQPAASSWFTSGSIYPQCLPGMLQFRSRKWALCWCATVRAQKSKKVLDAFANQCQIPSAKAKHTASVW